jgi:hypothetical protein
MRRFVVVGCLLAVGFGAAVPWPTLADDAPPAPFRQDALLAEWERRGSEIRTIDARFTRVDDQPEWMVKTRYDGRLLVKGSKLARLDLTKLGDGRDQAPYERIIRTPDVVHHYVYRTKRVFVYPYSRKAIQPHPREGILGLLGRLRGQIVESGRADRLPFLFVMRPAEWRLNYEITLVRETPQQAEFRIVPRRFATVPSVLTEARVRLDKTTLLPDEVQLTGPYRKDTETYRFTRIAVNGEIKDALFQLERPDGWEVIQEEPSP